MIEQIWDIGIGRIFNYAAIALLIANIGYVSYSFFVKKTYYDNLFITAAIYFSALIVEPISASIKFNSKYGYEIVDLFYFGVILYVIIIAIVRNNNYIMYNLTWESFYDITKEIFHKRGLESYYRQPTIYIGNGEASITSVAEFFSKKVIIVKYDSISSVMSIDELHADIREYGRKEEYRKERYVGIYYFLINVAATIILLANLKLL